METLRKHLLAVSLIICSLLFFTNNAKASHVAGGYIQLECTGTPGVYTVRLILYRDCSGISLSTSNKSIHLTSSCGGNIYANASYQNSFEVSQVCAADQNNTTCHGGSVPGYQQYVFEATVNLSACDHWTATYSLCCRNNPANLNSGSSTTFQVSSDFYTATDNCNTSPEVTAQPEPYVCLNQPVSYNLGALEPDGDSIVYTLTAPENNTYGYSGSYSAGDPIGGANIDPNSGTVTYVPQNTGSYVFVITMTEYDSNGDVVTVTHYEYQTTVIDCPNQTPEPPDANGGQGVSNITGSIIKNSPTSLTLCKGNSGCFDVVFTDPNAGQTLTVSSNISGVLPGATVTETGTNPVTVHVCYTPTGTSGIKTLSFLVEDDACPLTGQNNFGMTINVVDPGTANVSTTTEQCGGTDQGTATVSVTGGAGPYTYSITGPTNNTTPQTTNSSHQFTDLPPGNYDYTVSTPEGCDLTGTFTIVPGPDLQANITGNDLSCNGAGDGSATVTPTSGDAPYNYVWNQGGNPIGQTTATASNLDAGTYDVVATDAHGCTVDKTIIITEPTPLSGSLTPTDVTCNGDATGVVDASGASGGTPNYHYSLNGGTFQSGATFNGVDAGNYQVEIKDDNGCTITLNTTVNEPPALNIALVNTSDATCGSSTGSLEVSASGGSPTYSYSMGGAPQGSGQFNGVGSGTHTVTVTDNNGCTAQIDVTIGSVTSPTAVIDDLQNISCFGGNNGQVIIGTSNAPAPVTYSLDGGTGQPSNMFSNVTPGNHTVVVTDGNGCSASVDFAISQPTVLTFNTSVTDASCTGVCDGKIAVSPSGGQGPYQYSSDGGLTYGSNATLTNLCAGSVNVFIKDDNGCLYNQSVTVNEPTGLSTTLNLTDPTCRDGSDGQIEANPSGGSTPYQYSVDGGSLQGSNTLTGLSAGNHMVTITDDHGCSLDSLVLLNNPPGINIDTLSMHPSNCHSANGDISFTANGPNPIVNYTLDDGVNPPQTNASGVFSGLMAGAYKIYVTDTKGCIDSTFYGINDVEMDGKLLDTGSISCYGGNDGWASVENTLGKGANPITFELDNSGSAVVGNPYTSDPYSNYHYQFNNIAEGNHIITIYDDGNCIYTIPFYLGQPDSISFSQDVTGVSCNGGADGKIDIVNVTGGTGAYEYGQGGGFFVTYQASNEFTGLAQGTYTITVRDDNGCTQAHNIAVDQAPPITFTANVVDLTCHNDNTGAVQIIAHGGTGAYQYSNDGGTTFQSLNSFGGLAAGTYDMVVQDQNGCQHDSIITIIEPDTVQAVYTPINTLCNGSCDGKIVITASGGVGPYLYSQDNGITMTTNDTITGLCAGAYQVYVRDNHGCSITSTQTVNEPTAVTLVADSVPSTCSDPNGEIHIVAGGGTPTYTYSIDGGTMYVASGDFTGLPATNYNLAVKDDNGCVVTGAIEVTDMPSPEIDMLQGTDPLCFGDANGEIEVTATGGTGTLQYSVDGGAPQSSNILTGLLTGSHTVTITDNNGCSDTKSITLTEPAVLTMNPTPTDLTCYQNSTGKIQVVAQGGTPAYQYSFDNGTTYSPSPIDNFIPAGSYDVMVKDYHGCTVSQTVTVSEPSELIFNSVVVTDALCKSATNGEAQASALGGTTSYNYQWDDPSNQTTATASNLGAGDYTIVITDAQGCTIDSTITVNEPDSVEITAIDITNVTCNGDADGGLVIHSPTGSQFSIDGGATFQSNNTFTGLLAGTYNVQVQDANGCIVNRTASIFQADPVTLSINNDTTVCYAYNMKLYGNPGGGIQPYTYQWTNGSSTTDTLNIIATSTTTYSLQIFDYNGCPSSVENVTVTVLPKVSITVQQDTTICPGGTAVLTAAGADGLPGYSYGWSNGDSTATISVSPDSVTTYTATVTDQCSQSDAASAVVSIHDLPMPTLVADDTAGCTPLTVNFTNTTDPASIGGNCVWTIDGQTFNGCSGIPYTFTAPGCYDVSLQVTSPAGCVNDTTYSDYICIDDYPVADFTYTPEKPTILQNQINFENGSVGADTYSWTFQGEGTSTDENPSVTFGNAKEDSKIHICLIASSQLGCQDTVCHDVNFTSEFAVYVPNTFTPDDDQYNPTFLPIFPPDVEIAKYHLTIFDRWGEILFESYNYQVGWNGTYGGKVVKDGVYIWKIRVKEEGTNKKTREYVGHVTLLK